MEWEFELTNKIADELYKEAMTIYERAPYPFIHQNPFWINHFPEKNLFLSIKNNDQKLDAYAVLNVKPLRTLHMPFGPVVTDTSILVELLIKMVDWLRRKKYWQLTAQLPFPLDDKISNQLIELSKNISFRRSKTFFNWKSWWLPLDKEPMELLKSFSSQHKRNIKAAMRHGITHRLVADEKEAKALAGIYCRMYKQRKLSVNENYTVRLVTLLYRYFMQSQQGFMLISEYEGNIVGGVIIAFQRNHAFYYMGATSPELQKKIPILFATFYRAIELCKEKKMAVLDFGGFAENAKSTSRLSNINRFKIGFGGYQVDYPGLMLFDLNPFLSRPIQYSRLLRNKIRLLMQKE